MPRKSKPRKAPAPAESVWVAPRPAYTEPKRIEPVGTVKSNRYLEFADIALGAKKPSSPRKKSSSTLFPSSLNDQQKPQQVEQKSGGKVTPINSHKNSKTRNPNDGFGAFRNPH